MSRPRNAGIIVGVAAAALASGAAQAQAEPAPLVCLVSGYDVILRNDGAQAVAAGIVANWSVPFARREGTHTLEEPLGPGQMLFLSGALGASYLDSAKPCVISIGESAGDAMPQ